VSHEDRSSWDETEEFPFARKKKSKAREQGGRGRNMGELACHENAKAKAFDHKQTGEKMVFADRG